MGFQAGKFLKNEFLFFRGHAGAGIFDFQDDVAVVHTQVGGERDAALGGIFDGIGENIWKR